MFIYVIVCSETLKIYVGQHKRDDLQHYLQQKWYRAHYGPEQEQRSYLYRAMRNHPRGSWSIHSLVSGVETKAELDALEKHFIRALKTQHEDVGYNICAGGEGFTGEFTAESRQKMSVGHKKSWRDGSQRREDQREKARQNGKINGRKAKEDGTGIHAMTREQHQEVGRKIGPVAGRRAVESGWLDRIRELPQSKEAYRQTGLAAGRRAVESGHLDRIRELPQTKAAQRRTAEISRANKTGIFAPENQGKGGHAALAQKAGWFGRTPEQHTLDSKKAGHMRWHVKKNTSNPACALCQGEK